MLSHQLKQFTIDGEKTIIQNPNEAQRKEHEKCEFAVHEVYAIDVLISTGEGAGREKDTKVSIYKKTEENYQLKLKASRALITEVSIFTISFCQLLSCKNDNNFSFFFLIVFRFETNTGICHSIYDTSRKRRKQEWASSNALRIKWLNRSQCSTKSQVSADIQWKLSVADF